jgi:uncharacterized membrane protein YdfJ with MMPL/SSD domain
VKATPYWIGVLLKVLASHGVPVPKQLEPLMRAPRPAQQGDQQQPRLVSITDLDDLLTGPMLVSADGHATLVVVGLTSEFLETRNGEILRDVESLLDQLRRKGAVPEGLGIDLSGSATLGTSVNRAVSESTRAVRRWAIWIAVALLLIVFRAPLGR